jgi:hypothetical protein
MSDHQAAATPAATPSLALAGQIIIAIVIAIAVWIALGTFVFHIRSFFASFLFLWYWGVIDKMNFAALPSTILGALIGAALAWILVVLTAHFGGAGTAIAVLVIVAAIFAQIMGWAPIAFNGATTLFLTVMTAPQIMGGVNFAEVDAAILLGAVYFAGGMYIAQRIIGARAQSKARLDPA